MFGQVSKSNQILKMRTRTSTIFVLIQRLEFKDKIETCTKILMKEKSVKMFNIFFYSKCCYVDKNKNNNL